MGTGLEVFFSIFKNTFNLENFEMYRNSLKIILKLNQRNIFLDDSLKKTLFKK